MDHQFLLRVAATARIGGCTEASTLQTKKQKKRSKIRPKSSQNHFRGRLEGPWGPIGTPSEKKVEK